MRKIPEGERERRNGRERNGKWKRAALEKSQNWGRQKNADLNLTQVGIKFVKSLDIKFV